MILYKLVVNIPVIDGAKIQFVMNSTPIILNLLPLRHLKKLKLEKRLEKMKAYVFPGQGAQFVGMGKDLYENNFPLQKRCLKRLTKSSDFRITDLNVRRNRRRSAPDKSDTACHFLTLSHSCEKH